MNHVSWFIYIAEVTENFQTVMVCLGLAGMIGCAICWFAYSVADDRVTATTCARMGRILPLTGAVILLVACFIPGKTTMYAIAASQLGEVVASSADAKEMIDDTKQILREYLKSLKKDSSK